MDLKILQLLLFLCMKLLVSGVGAAEFGCMERERRALFKLTESLAGDLSELTRGSEEDKENCCKWNRVGCGGTAHVTFLDLSGMDLRGKISPALQELPHLNYLDLGDNYLTIDNLDWLSNVSSLSHLDLSGINLRSVTNWVQPISKLSSLEELYLSGCQLGDHPLSALDLFANSSLSSLSTLDLSNNQLDGPIPHLFHNLSEMISLQTIYLSDNQFVGSLPDITRFSSLRDLYLSNNQLDGVQPQSPDQPSSLEILDLSYNQISGSLSDLRGFSSLYRLDLSGNQLKKLPKAIEKLFNLKSLNLSSSSLEDNQLEGELPDCWMNFHGLTVLNLANNKLSDDEKRSDDDDNALVQWKGQESEYKRLKNLKGIDLSSNKLVGTIPQAFSDLRALVFINLSRNHLTGNIISSIGQLDTLEWLDLSRNQLSGEIPNGLANLHFLDVLDLSYNNLTGKIPLSTQLQSFNTSTYIGNNQLCGDPLARCPPDPSIADHDKVNIVEKDDRFINRDFYICMTFGFITGFWVVVGTLVLKHSWRHSYFNFWNNVGGWMYVTTTIYVTRFKRKFMA